MFGEKVTIDRNLDSHHGRWSLSYMLLKKDMTTLILVVLLGLVLLELKEMVFSFKVILWNCFSLQFS